LVETLGRCSKLLGFTHWPALLLLLLLLLLSTISWLLLRLL
jgi:hypothetical protein